MAHSKEDRAWREANDFVTYYKEISPPRICNAAVTLSFLFELKSTAWIAFQQNIGDSRDFDQQYIIYILVLKNDKKTISKLIECKCFRLRRLVDIDELIDVAKESAQIFHYDRLRQYRHAIGQFRQNFLIRHRDIPQKLYTLHVPAHGLMFS